MNARILLLLSGLLAVTPSLRAQAGSLTLPARIQAGAAFSIESSGAGNGTLYIVGPAQVLRRDVQLGTKTLFAAGSLYNEGHYIVVLAGGSATSTGSLDVTSTPVPADLAFLARPSRLPVSMPNGITGAVYVFDTYNNLITTPVPVTFELSAPAGSAQTRTVTTKNGAAWTAVDSTSQQGQATFRARIGTVSSARVIGQVPGEPCALKMSAHPAGANIGLETEPVRDCSGNAVPDGTIVTFTETYNGQQAVVDVPLKHGVAKVDMPAHKSATISIASGVVLGNQIRWER